MTTLARIHDQDVLDTTKMQFSDVRKTVKRSDSSIDCVGVTRAPVVGFVESDDGRYRQIMELLSNKNFSPMHIQDDYSINLYGDPVNLRHTLKGRDGNVMQWTVTVQNHYWKLLMDWETRVIETDWDTLDEWTDADPSWDNLVGTYAWATGVMTLQNLEAVKSEEVELWHSDYDVSMDFGHVDAVNGIANMLLRKQGGSADYNTAYKVSVTWSSGVISFFKRTSAPADVLLKVWDTGSALEDWDIANTTYTLRVLCQGNKFDVWFNGEYLGWVYDETYQTGWVGAYCNWTGHKIENVLIEHAKPVAVRLPVGAHDYNKIRMPGTTRLNDDICADGISRTVIAPSDPIEFKQDRIAPFTPSSCMLFLGLEEGGGSTVYDDSGNDVNGTIAGAKWKRADTNLPFKHYLEFDGDNDRVQGTMDEIASEHIGTVTVECYFRKNETPDASKRFSPFSGWIWALGGWGIDFYNGSDNLLFTISDDNGYGYNSISDYTPYDSEWVYVACVFDPTESGDNRMRTYINGTGPYTATISETSFNYFMTIPSAQSYSLGYSSVNADYGKVDVGFAGLYKEAWSAEQVKQRWDTLALNSPAGGEVKVWDTMGEDGLWSYLEFHAKFDEGRGTSFYDSSRHNRTITEYNIDGTEWEASSYNKWAKTCFHPNGTNDYFGFSLDGEDIDSHGWTIGGWFNLDDLTASSGLWYIFGDSMATLYTDINTNGSIYVKTDASVTDGEWTSNAGVITAGQWYFIVVTWSGDVTKDPILYVNGSAIVWDSTTPISGTVGDADIVEMAIATNVLDGLMDDPFIYSTDVSATRTKWLYENMPNMVIEESFTEEWAYFELPLEDDALWSDTIFYLPMHEGYGSQVTDKKGAKTSTGGVFPDWEEDGGRYVLDFDGTEYINFSDHNDFSFDVGSPDAPFTFAIWIKPTIGHATAGLFSKDNITTANEYWNVLISNGSFAMYVQQGTLANGKGRSTPLGTFTANEWQHIMITYDGAGDPWTGMKIYRNNVRVDIKNEGTTYTGMQNLTADFEIGRSLNSSTRFDGKMKEFIIFDKVLSTAERATVYGMEDGALEQRAEDLPGWQRVYDPNHQFVGDMIVDNGLIRVSQNYRVPDGETYAFANAPKIQCYTDGIWNDFSLWMNLAHSTYFSEYESVVIKNLERYKVVLEGMVEHTSGEWAQYELYIIMGSPFMLIKLVDWKFDVNIATRASAKSRFINGATGYDQSPRFGLASLDDARDGVVDTGTNDGTETEGLSIAFSTQNNILCLYLDQDNTDWKTHIADSCLGIPGWNGIAIDFDADTPPHWWGMGLMKFDTSNLQCQQNSASSDDQWDITNAKDATNGQPGAGGFSVRLDQQNQYCFYDVGSLPKGAYEIRYRVKDSAAETNGLYMKVRNSTDATWLIVGDSSQGEQENTTTAWAWYKAQFLVDDDDVGDNIRIIAATEIVRTIDVDIMYVDQFTIWPIGNSKNFPLDARNQALRLITQKLRGLEK